MKSPVHEHIIFGRNIFLKRDDLMKSIGGLNGNKGRKLFSLTIKKPFPTIVASFGGVQSNSMMALAKCCANNRARFLYFVRNIPKSLDDFPIGNYRLALEMGMEVCAINL